MQSWSSPAFILAVAALVAGCTDPAVTDDDALATASALVFRDPVDLGSKARVGAFGTNCQDSAADGDCGLGEPQVEVDSLGQVYVSGVCCLTVSPPVYVSRDGGATFEELATPMGVREAFGIEGDFAIDAMGRVYFADIEFAGSFQITVWEADGTFVRHGKFPAPPLVDRDWVRAEGDGIVYYTYNTGTQTLTYLSTDAAQTFTPVPWHITNWGLGTSTGGPMDGGLAIAGGNAGGMRQLDSTTDAGATWTVEATSLPVGGTNTPGAFDEGGNLYLTNDVDDRIVVAPRDAAGTWREAVNVTGGGKDRLPWIAAGSDGSVALAWYGTTPQAADRWHLHVATSIDHGQTWNVQVADPEPSFVGDLQRELLDFLQVDLGPDGAVHVAYSKLPDDGTTEEQLAYVRSDPAPHLAAEDFRSGP